MKKWEKDSLSPQRIFVLYKYLYLSQSLSVPLMGCSISYLEFQELQSLGLASCQMIPPPFIFCSKTALFALRGISRGFHVLVRYFATAFECMQQLCLYCFRNPITPVVRLWIICQNLWTRKAVDHSSWDCIRVAANLDFLCDKEDDSGPRLVYKMTDQSAAEWSLIDES